MAAILNRADYKSQSVCRFLSSDYFLRVSLKSIFWFLRYFANRHMNTLRMWLNNITTVAPRALVLILFEAETHYLQIHVLLASAVRRLSVSSGGGAGGALQPAFCRQLLSSLTELVHQQRVLWAFAPHHLTCRRFAAGVDFKDSLHQRKNNKNYIMN